MQCHKGSGMLRKSVDDVLLRRESFFRDVPLYDYS